MSLKKKIKEKFYYQFFDIINSHQSDNSISTSQRLIHMQNKNFELLVQLWIHFSVNAEKQIVINGMTDPLTQIKNKIPNDWVTSSATVDQIPFPWREDVGQKEWSYSWCKCEKQLVRKYNGGKKTLYYNSNQKGQNS